MISVDFNTIWNDVKNFWGCHRLAKPIVYTNKTEADKVMGNEIAFFDIKKKTISVHYPNLVNRLGASNLGAIEKHEAGHHTFCPYELKTLLRMINESDKVLDNMDQAKYLENILSDIYVNTRIVQKGDNSIIDVYRAMGKNLQDKLWNVYMRTCEKLWGIPAGELSASVDSQMETDACSLEKLVSGTMGSIRKWPDASREFTLIMKKYLPTSTGRGLIDEHSPADFVEDGDVEKGTKGLAKELGPERYKKIMAGTGLADRIEVNRLLYRDLAREYRFKFASKKQVGNGSYPYTPVEWEPGQDIRKLDVVYSVRKTGMLIPGFQTYSWQTQDGTTGAVNKSYPDLLIVLDSSGSMANPNSCTSMAVLSSLVAAYSALDAGSKVAVINFSSNCDVLKYTKKQKLIEDKILAYFGGGTDIPGKEMLDVVNSNYNKQHIIIITDAGISNLNSELGYLKQSVKKAGSGTIFLLGSGNASSLENTGYIIKPMNSMQDLLELTRQTVNSIYR